MGRIRVVGVWLVAALALATASATTASATSYGVMSWGYNRFGQLGDGGTKNLSAPLTLIEPNEVTAVSAGRVHSLALLADGAVSAWGENKQGQLGDGSTVKSTVPVLVSGLSEASAISAGGEHSLALLSSGSVVAWGDDESGQLGDEGTTSSDVPVPVKGLSEVTAVAAGGAHSLALLQNGTVMAWGNNEAGQLGDESTTSSDVPVAVKGLSEVTAIAAGGEHSLALLRDGTVMAWGGNEHGQLGDESTAGSDVPVAVARLSQVTAIAAGGEHSLALLSDGTVVAWGDNEQGQLGDASNGPETCLVAGEQEACSRTPVAASGLGGVVAVSAGYAHSLALLQAGTVAAWGLNYYGELGIGNNHGPETCHAFFSFHLGCSRSPVAVSELSEAVVGVSAGGFSNLAYGPPGPVVTNVSPDNGSPGGGTTVTITGANLEGATAVRFGSADAHIITVTPTAITAESPPGAGKVHVTVTVPGTTINTSSAIRGRSRFRYEAPGAPEYGRCTKVSRGTGSFSSGSCKNHKAAGNFEWLPGVERTGFTLAGAAATLDTAGGSKIVCKSETGAGEYKGTKELTNTVIKLAGCELAGSKCSSAGAEEGEIVTSGLEGELGWRNEERFIVALDLFPAEEAGPFAEFTCATTTVLLQGSVLVPVKTDKMSLKASLKYVASKSRQKPEAFEDEPKDVLEASINGGEPEQTGLSLVATLTSEEALEVNASV